MQSSTCAVQHMAIFKLRRRLTDAHLSKIRPQIDARAYNTVRKGPPYRNFHFVMRVVGAGVEYVNLPGLTIGPNITVP